MAHESSIVCKTLTLCVRTVVADCLAMYQPTQLTTHWMVVGGFLRFDAVPTDIASVV